MRAVILYYLVQAQAAERHRHAQRDAPTRAASRARHPRTPGRRRACGLPAVLARRVRTVLGGGSP